MQRAVIAVPGLLWLAALVIYAANSGVLTAIEKEFGQLGEALHRSRAALYQARAARGSSGRR